MLTLNNNDSIKKKVVICLQCHIFWHIGSSIARIILDHPASERSPMFRNFLVLVCQWYLYYRFYFASTHECDQHIF